jgi:hypothetical protein
MATIPPGPAGSKEQEETYERITNQTNTNHSAAGSADAQAGAAQRSGQAGKTRGAIRRDAGAGAVPLLQAGMGGQRGKRTQFARVAICVSVLRGVSPRFRCGARIQKIAPSAVEQTATGSRIRAAGEEKTR